MLRPYKEQLLTILEALVPLLICKKQKVVDLICTTDVQGTTVRQTGVETLSSVCHHCIKTQHLISSYTG